jgi:hypothetical protein
VPFQDQRHTETCRDREAYRQFGHEEGYEKGHEAGYDDGWNAAREYDEGLL